MMHIYAIVLAVVLLIGALAAIIVCVCVDIVPIIKSRGSTLMSRDSITQEQTRMLKKSLQRSKLTSSASADFIDSVQGRKVRGQGLRQERPRYGSTPLALLSADDEKSEEIAYKTTTVIIEALPKKSTSENNQNIVDNAKESNDKDEDQNPPVSENGKEVSARYEVRSELERLKGRSGSSPNVATKRSNSMDFLDQNIDSSQRTRTYNSRNQGNYESEAQPGVYPKPSVTRILHPISTKEQNHTARDPTEHNNATDGTLHSSYGHHIGNIRGHPLNEDNFAQNPGVGTTFSSNSGSPHCHWCVIERGSHLSHHERHLAFSRNKNYEANSSPNLKPHQMQRQRSFEEPETGMYPNGFPYDRNKFCKNPHRGYSPCPDCFHSSNATYYMHDYNTDMTTQSEFPAISTKPALQGGMIPQMISTSSSSSSSGSSTRFRHIRQPLEDIQEDASDCYATREIGATSTIDSRDLESGPDDGTIPKSTDNSIASASPIIPSQSHTPVMSNSAT